MVWIDVMGKGCFTVLIRKRRAITNTMASGKTTYEMVQEVPVSTMLVIYTWENGEVANDMG